MKHLFYWFCYAIFMALTIILAPIMFICLIFGFIGEGIHTYLLNFNGFVDTLKVPRKDTVGWYIKEFQVAARKTNHDEETFMMLFQKFIKDNMESEK